MHARDCCPDQRPDREPDVCADCCAHQRADCRAHRVPDSGPDCCAHAGADRLRYVCLGASRLLCLHGAVRHRCAVALALCCHLPAPRRRSVPNKCGADAELQRAPVPRSLRVHRRRVGRVHQIMWRRHASAARDDHHRSRARRRRVPRSSGSRVQHTGVPNAGTYGSADQCANSCTHGCADCRTHRHANIGAYHDPNGEPDICAYACANC